MATRLRQPDDDPIAALRATVVQLEARIERLEARHGPRDEADRALLLALIRAASGYVFTAGDVIRRGRVVPDLGAALLAADLEGAKALGCWLRRMEGVPAGGFVLARGPRGRRGRLWRVGAVTACHVP